MAALNLWGAVIKAATHRTAAATGETNLSEPTPRGSPYSSFSPTADNVSVDEYDKPDHYQKQVIKTAGSNAQVTRHHSSLCSL